MIVYIKNEWEIPWQSSGKDSALSQLWAQVPSLVRDLRSHKPCSTAKKINLKKNLKNDWHIKNGTEDKDRPHSVFFN